jgi:hypothetical protein
VDEGAVVAAGIAAGRGLAADEVVAPGSPYSQSQPSPVSLAVQTTCLVFFASTGSESVKPINRAAAGALKRSVRAKSLAKSDIIYYVRENMCAD